MMIAAGPALFTGLGGAQGDLERAIELLAEARRDEGLRDLAPDLHLNAMARTQALYMRGTGTASHMGAEGDDPVARALHAGYRGKLLGEAVADTGMGVAETLAQMLDTPAARAVLLNRRAREVGLARTIAPDGRRWWAIVVGVPT